MTAKLAARLSKARVHYRPAGPHDRERCASCVMFRPAIERCTLVVGKIRKSDVCDRWEAK